MGSSLVSFDSESEVHENSLEATNSESLGVISLGADSDARKNSRSKDLGDITKENDRNGEHLDDGVRFIGGVAYGPWVDRMVEGFDPREWRLYTVNGVEIERLGTLFNKDDVPIGIQYRRECINVDLPYLDEEDDQLVDLYVEPADPVIREVRDIEVTWLKILPVDAQYLTFSSHLSAEKEGELQEEFDIPEEYIISFLDPKASVSDAPEGWLSVCTAQLWAGLRFPLHPLFGDILRFWQLQLG